MENLTFIIAVKFVDLDQADEIKSLILNNTDLFHKRENDLKFGLKIALYLRGMSESESQDAKLKFAPLLCQIHDDIVHSRALEFPDCER